MNKEKITIQEKIIHPRGVKWLKPSEVDPKDKNKWEKWEDLDPNTKSQLLEVFRDIA